MRHRLSRCRRARRDRHCDFGLTVSNPGTLAPFMEAPARPTSPFVWPPRPLPEELESLPPKKEQPVKPRVRRGFASWITEVESTWLDPTAGPLHRRQQLTGWSPDPFDAFCDRCGHDVGTNEATEFGCARCRDLRLPWERFIRLGAYEPPLSDWICEVKFNRSIRLGLQLGALLGVRIRESLAQRPLPGPQTPIALPAPTHLLRRLSRGIDHAAVVAQGLAGPLEGQVCRGLRSRSRPSQRSLSMTARRTNLTRSMRLRGPAQGALRDRLVILVDDVSTTGATLREAARAALEPFGARPQGSGRPRLWAAALAVTPDRHARADEPE